MAIAFARLVYEETCDYASIRETFGKPIVQHQAIRHKLVDMHQRCRLFTLWNGRASLSRDTSPFDWRRDAADHEGTRRQETQSVAGRKRRHAIIKLEWPKPGYARIVFARAAHHNVLRNQELEALDAATRKIADSECRVVSLVAEGRSFSVSGDIAEFGTGIDGDARRYVCAGSRVVIATLTRLRKMKAALVVGAQGNVAGGSTGFRLAADFEVAADNLKINLAYVRIGASPDAGVFWLLMEDCSITKPVRAADSV